MTLKPDLSKKRDIINGRYTTSETYVDVIKTNNTVSIIFSCIKFEKGYKEMIKCIELTAVPINNLSFCIVMLCLEQKHFSTNKWI
jgi:hypothetical protein